MYIVIPTHNEEVVFNLLNIVIANKNPEDRVLVYDDFSEADYANRLQQFCDAHGFMFFQHKFEEDFAAHWNHVHTLIPQGEWLVWLASDEIVDPVFFKYIKNEIETYNIEKYLLARINTYYDESTEVYKLPDIDWNGDLGTIGFRYPDWQARVYKNCSHIKWQGKVHEGIVGSRSEKQLSGKGFTILHHRSRQKVAKSDTLYHKIGHPSYRK